MQRSGATLLPIDSEHNAIFQCLPHGRRGRVSRHRACRRVLLTASGGPFRDRRARRSQTSPPSRPGASELGMGRKISVDSATLMNKGLELIEACLLFGLRPAQVEVVVHPQSIVHSLVEYIDGSVLAQLGAPDMRTPDRPRAGVAGARQPPVYNSRPLKVGRLDFGAPDLRAVPLPGAGAGAPRAPGGSHPAALNAANEVAVEAFLEAD